MFFTASGSKLLFSAGCLVVPNKRLFLIPRGLSAREDIPTRLSGADFRLHHGTPVPARTQHAPPAAEQNAAQALAPSAADPACEPESPAWASRRCRSPASLAHAFHSAHIHAQPPHSLPQLSCRHRAPACGHTPAAETAASEASPRARQSLPKHSCSLASLRRIRPPAACSPQSPESARTCVPA